MDFKQRLNDLMVENELNYHLLAKNTGIPVTTLSNYINRGSLPSIIQLSILADYFEVSVDYLIGREDDFGIKKAEGAVAPPAYSKEEQKIIEDYRRLNFMSKKLVLQTLATLQPSASSEELQKKNKNG